MAFAVYGILQLPSVTNSPLIRLISLHLVGDSAGARAVDLGGGGRRLSGGGPKFEKAQKPLSSK